MNNKVLDLTVDGEQWSNIKNIIPLSPGDSTLNLSKILEDILASRRSHTRGNLDTEILQGVENPEILLRSSGKEQINISQFGASSSEQSIAFGILGGKQILKGPC